MNIKIIIDKLITLVDADNIVAANISALNDGDEFLESKFPIILSIVNIEEDNILKNQSLYIPSTKNANKIDRYSQSTKYLIISLLFSSYNKDLSKYLEGIDKLNNILHFFQQNTFFYFKNDETELINSVTFLGKPEVQKESYTKITFESVSLSMEQLFQMWSFLGSRYMPSMLFKMRLVTVQTSTTIEDTLIKQINVNLWENNKDDVTGLLEKKIHPPKE